MGSKQKADSMCTDPPAETKGFYFQQTMLRIKDPKRSLEFYSKVLGMRLLQSFDFPDMKFSLFFLGYCEAKDIPKDDKKRSLNCFRQVATLELTHNWGTETSDEEPYHNGNSDPKGFGHIGIVVPNVESACKRFDTLGVKFIKKPDQGSQGGMDSAEVANEFELQMQKELEENVAAVRNRQTIKENESNDGSKSSAAVAETEKDGTLSNDDLFYDPNIDDENENWVRSHRARCHPEGKIDKLHSDAVLNCPACMTLLCLDCQRHDVYTNQYRAIFVTNCKVDYSNLLTVQETRRYRQKKRRRKEREESESAASPDDQFHPVSCSQCSTIVAMFDNDEVFHFFNILASHS